MQTATEKRIRDLKAAIKRTRNPLQKSNLQFALKSTIRDLAEKHEAEKVRRYAGNQF